MPGLADLLAAAAPLFAVIEVGQNVATSVNSAGWIVVAAIIPIVGAWVAHVAGRVDPERGPRGLLVVSTLAYGISSIADEVTDGSAGLFWETSTIVAASLSTIAFGWVFSRSVHT